MGLPLEFHWLRDFVLPMQGAQVELVIELTSCIPHDIANNNNNNVLQFNII